jgi:hypothetical protein
MIQNGLILTGNDAELLSNALEVVKAKFYEKSETNLDDTQALDAIVSCFRTREKEEQKKETHHAYLSPIGKRLMLGTIIGRQGDADSREG